MTKVDYCTYRGWLVPRDEDPNEAGYLVEYVEGKEAHIHPQHVYYISWSPATEFEATYRPSGTWQERLLIERDDLVNRTLALGSFIASEGFAKVSEDGRVELASQYGIMEAYVSTLGIRIETARLEGLMPCE